MANPLEQVRKGQKVIDDEGQMIGKVEWVHLSDEDPTTVQAETVTAPETEDRTSLLDYLANIFSTDAVPDVLRKRLLREGFVRVDADELLASDRYILPDQIRSVSDKQVILNVNRDALISRWR